MQAVTAPDAKRWSCSHCLASAIAGSRPVWCGTCGETNTMCERTVQAKKKQSPRAHLFQKRPRSIATQGAAATPPGPDDADDEAPPSGERQSFEWGSNVQVEQVVRVRSGWKPWAHVTGELVRGKVHLMGGNRGAGKTRTLLRVAGAIARTEAKPVLYVCNEITTAACALWASEVGVTRGALRRIAFSEEASIESVIAMARTIRPCVLVIDAFKVATWEGEPCKAGTDAEELGFRALHHLTRDLDLALVLVLHNRGDQKAYSLGSAPTQGCDSIYRVDKLPADDKRAPGVLLSCDEKNRYATDTNRALIQHGPMGLVLHPMDTEVPR